MTNSPPLRVDPETFPELDEHQVGHLRHIENLAWQSDGDWDLMGSEKAMQEWVDSYRYQLAQMAYAVGFAHFHHVPAAPGAFKPVFERLIHKMLLPEVWVYWRETSRSGIRVNPDITELRDGWTDPVVNENIMYSGRLLAVVGMHSMLFDSDKYRQQGAITFRWDPIFYGMGPEVYEYDFDSLTEVLYWQMVESGYLGIVCEPNCLFLVCNQFAILGFRFHDLRSGRRISEEVANSFTDAWDKAKGGFLDEYGDYWRFWLIEQDRPIYSSQGATSAWVGLNMNAWNREFVRERYQSQVLVELHERPDGLISLIAPTVANERRAAEGEGRPPRFETDLDFKWGYPAFGYTAAWMSEMGDAERLSGMLAYADAYMQPQWERGGLYYPRNDHSWDAGGNMVYMDRLTGNAMLAYARLNVSDGLWKMYNQPWDRSHFRQPHLSAVSDGVTVSRGWFDEQQQVLVFTLLPRHGDRERVSIVIGGVLARGQAWGLYSAGELVVSGSGTRVTPTSENVRAEQRSGELHLEFELRSRTTFGLQFGAV